MEGTEGVVNAIFSNIIQILTILTTFISSGGLMAIVKYRNESKEMGKTVEKLKEKIEKIEKLICYRRECPNRLKDRECNSFVE